MRKTRFVTLLLTAAMVLGLFGCDTSKKNAVKLDPKNPITITVWHYYNGAVMNAFDQQVKAFNETVGLEQGIIIQGSGMGNVSELQSAVLAAARKDVGSREMPNIFASYADTAYAAERMGILADLGQQFSEEELAEYMPGYIEEGRIGDHNELRIFPIAKSTEIFMLNETDWQPFAADTGYTHADLATPESLAEVAKAYYEWTDAKTPDIANDGKAFYGRDAVANMFVIGAKQLGAPIITVDGGTATVVADKGAMRRIWDTYYLPYVSGYFLSAGRYRSDDTKVGEIAAYVGSTSSAMYFPAEVTAGDSTYPVEATILPSPVFVGGAKVMVQQGAGMAVTKSTPEAEYASALFLKWFTDTNVNIQFAAQSGYMPVKKAANDYNAFMAIVAEHGITQDEISRRTLEVAFEAVNKSELYTSRAFNGGTQARSILENLLQNKAVEDRAAVVALLESGSTLDAALTNYDNDTNFEAWYSALSSALAATLDVE